MRATSLVTDVILNDVRAGSRWWIVGGVSAALLSAVVIAFVLVGPQKTPPQEPGVNLPGGPLGPGAPEVTLHEAVTRAGFTVIRPHDEIEDDDAVARAWLRTGPAGEVALLYRSGVMALVSPAQVRDVDSFFKAQVQDGLVGQVVQVNGGTALLILSNGRSHGALDLFVDGIEIQVIGPDGLDLSRDDLTRVVQSIA